MKNKKIILLLALMSMLPAFNIDSAAMKNSNNSSKNENKMCFPDSHMEGEDKEKSQAIKDEHLVYKAICGKTYGTGIKEKDDMPVLEYENNIPENADNEDPVDHMNKSQDYIKHGKKRKRKRKASILTKEEDTRKGRNTKGSMASTNGGSMVCSNILDNLSVNSSSSNISAYTTKSNNVKKIAFNKIIVSTYKQPKISTKPYTSINKEQNKNESKDTILSDKKDESNSAILSDKKKEINTDILSYEEFKQVPDKDDFVYWGLGEIRESDSKPKEEVKIDRKKIKSKKRKVKVEKKLEKKLGDEELKNLEKAKTVYSGMSDDLKKKMKAIYGIKDGKNGIGDRKVVKKMAKNDFLTITNPNLTTTDKNKNSSKLDKTKYKSVGCSLGKFRKIGSGSDSEKENKDLKKPENKNADIKKTITNKKSGKSNSITNKSIITNNTDTNNTVFTLSDIDTVSSKPIAKSRKNTSKSARLDVDISKQRKKFGEEKRKKEKEIKNAKKLIEHKKLKKKEKEDNLNMLEPILERTEEYSSNPSTLIKIKKKDTEKKKIKKGDLETSHPKKGIKIKFRKKEGPKTTDENKNDNTYKEKSINIIKNKINKGEKSAKTEKGLPKKLFSSQDKYNEENHKMNKTSYSNNTPPNEETTTTHTSYENKKKKNIEINQKQEPLNKIDFTSSSICGNDFKEEYLNSLRRNYIKEREELIKENEIVDGEYTDEYKTLSNINNKLYFEKQNCEYKLNRLRGELETLIENKSNANTEKILENIKNKQLEIKKINDKLKKIENKYYEREKIMNNCLSDTTVRYKLNLLTNRIHMIGLLKKIKETRKNLGKLLKNKNLDKDIRFIELGHLTEEALDYAIQCSNVQTNYVDLLLPDTALSEKDMALKKFLERSYEMARFTYGYSKKQEDKKLAKYMMNKLENNGDMNKITEYERWEKKYKNYEQELGQYEKKIDDLIHVNNLLADYYNKLKLVVPYMKKISNENNVISVINSLTKPDTETTIRKYTLRVKPKSTEVHEPKDIGNLNKKKKNF